VELWKNQAAFSPDFSQAAAGNDALCRFPRARHFHSRRALRIVTTNPMWSESDRDGLVQMLMYRDLTTSQGCHAAGSVPAASYDWQS